MTLGDRIKAVISRWGSYQPAAVGGSPPPSIGGYSSNEGSVLALSAAWACVNLLAGTVASLPIEIYVQDAKGDLTPAFDHPLYSILHDSPNADQTAMDFWEGGQAALELRGNMVARKEKMGDRLIGLTPVYNPLVTRDRRTGGLRYQWSEDGRSYDEPQENIFHVRGFGGSPLGGLSTLSYGARVFGLSSAVDTSAQTTFVNGVRPSGVLTMEKFLTKEQRDPVEKALGDKYAGAVNAGRPMLLEGGMKWTQISITPEDAQMLESRNFSIEEVARLFGVPPHMIGHIGKNTALGSSIEQQTLGFVMYALRKRLKRIEQAAEKQLLTAADRARGVRIRFNMEALLRADSAARAAFFKEALAGKWMTINEVRRKEGLPSVPWGDMPWGQMQDVQLGPDGKPPVANPVRV